MNITMIRKRRGLTSWVRIALLLTLVTGPMLAILPEAKTARAASSADPSEEIVYIDRSGVIRVLDPQGEAPRVEWQSPDSDWKDADLGDVNNDGDLEIVAIGRTPNGDVKLAVFDPVIASGISDPDKEINGIPWDTLYYIEVAGSPEIVQSNNFDNGIDGDEILYAYQDPASQSRVVVLKAATLDPATGNPTGREWVEHVSFEDEATTREWSFGRSGDVNNQGSDEAVLVDEDSSETRFDVFDMDRGFTRIDGKNSGSDTIRKVAIGQIIEGNGEEIAEIRSTKPGSPSLKVYKWDAEDNDLATDEDWAFSPQPESVFLADLDGNGDKEVLFLRNGGGAGRLIMRDEWGDDQDDQLDIEESLDDIEGGGADEFKIGAGGDVDGDGRDEIIIASKDRIVIFRDPHPGGSVSSGSRTEVLRDTNNDTLLVGDLDSQGFIRGPVFGVDKNLIEASLPTGTTKLAGSFTLTNIGSGTNVGFFIVTPLPDWVQVSPLSGSTPANINVTFNATNESVGNKSFTLEISSAADVVNKPVSVQLEMTVEPAAFSLDPSAANFIYFPCTTPLTETRQMEIEIGGTAGLNFEATILGVPEAGDAGSVASAVTGGEITEDGRVLIYGEDGGTQSFAAVGQSVSGAAVDEILWPGNVPWITAASSPTHTVPTNLTLEVDPTSLGADFGNEHAVLVLVADTRAGSPPDNVEVMPIMMMCANGRVLAPALLR